MEKHILKKRNSVWLKLIVAIIVLVIGSAGGFKLYEVGNKVGCFPLEDDIVPVEISPYSEDNLQQNHCLMILVVF